MHDWRDVVCKRLEKAGIDPVADSSLIEELAHHLDDRFTESIARGATSDQALADALRELDDHERLAPELVTNRAARVPAPALGGPRLSSRIGAVLQDIRYGVRTLQRSRGFTIAAVITVALSTAPAIAVLSFGNWLLRQQAPGVLEPERVGNVTFGFVSGDDGLTVTWPSREQVRMIADDVQSVAGMAGMQWDQVSIAPGNGEPRAVRGVFVSANYFDVLGVRMAAGRPFGAEEDIPPDGAAVAILSQRLASSLFSDRSPVGASIRINGLPTTVIGVTPANFAGATGLDPTDVWLPGESDQFFRHTLPANRRPFTEGPYYQYVFRLAPRSTFEQAAREFQVAMRNFPPRQLRSGLRPMEARTSAGLEDLPSARIAVIGALLGVTGLLVVAAAANLANMFVFRGIRRTRELAVRRALGASTGRLAQVTIMESLIVATLGCLGGLILVWIAQEAISGVTIGPMQIPEIPMDWRLLLITIALAFGVGIGTGAVPARLAVRPDLAIVIGTHGRTASGRGSRVRIGFAALQLALSLTFMIGALLFIGTLQNLRAVNPGFQANGMTLYRPLLRTQGYSPEGGLLLFQEVLARLASTPGITAAGIAHGVPLVGGSISSRVFLSGQDPETGVRVQYSDVSSGYFDAVGTPLIAGRIFTTDETLRGGLEESVIISESLARRLYGTVLAVGKSLMFPSRLEPVRLQIIGVARDVNWDDLAETPPFIVYRPMTRFNPTNIHFVVRSPEEPVAVVSEVRKLIREIDPSLPVEPMTMNQVLSIRMAQQRAFAWVLGLLATMGFMLAFLGIHGLVFQWVTDRIPEFGIRIAVGAGRQQIIRLVLRSTLTVVAVGLPLGVALAAGLARVLQNRLFGVSAGEPVAYISAIAALLLIVLGASIIPAYSAARSNPADVLRAE